MSKIQFKTTLQAIKLICPQVTIYKKMSDFFFFKLNHIENSKKYI